MQSLERCVLTQRREYVSEGSKFTYSPLYWQCRGELIIFISDPKTHKRFKRTLFNQTVQDRMQNFVEVFFFFFFKKLRTIHEQTNHLNHISLVPASFCKTLTGDRKVSDLFVFLLFVATEKKIFSKIAIQCFFVWLKSVLLNSCVFLDLSSERRQSTLSQVFIMILFWLIFQLLLLYCTTVICVCSYVGRVSSYVSVMALQCLCGTAHYIERKWM